MNDLFRREKFAPLPRSISEQGTRTHDYAVGTMNISFEGKVALVTGAASGLGLATAKAFAESGAAVALADWNRKAVGSAAEELAAKGYKTLAIQCDVAVTLRWRQWLNRPSLPSGGLMQLTIMPAFKMLLRKPRMHPGKTLTV